MMTHKAIPVFLFAGILLAAVAAGATPAPEGARLIEKTKLKNGMTVVIRENPSSPAVAVQVWVKAGSTTEPESLVVRSGAFCRVENRLLRFWLQTAHGLEVEALGG